VGGRQLLIAVDTPPQRDSVIRFLSERGCDALPAGETRIAIEDCDKVTPGLSTIVALVEEWRCAAHVGEIALELEGRRTVLRTET